MLDDSDRDGQNATVSVHVPTTEPLRRQRDGQTRLVSRMT
jgi:hypothetical protein